MGSRLLEKLYTKSQYGVAFSSWQKIWKKAKEIDSSVTQEQVKEFLRNKTSHSLFAQVSKKFQKRKMMSLSPKMQVSIDLMELSGEDKKKNIPYRYLFTQIDMFSRFLQVHPMKSKNVESVKKALLKMFQSYKPRSILCDRESSFYSREILDFLNGLDIKLISQQSAPTLKWKNGMIERCIRTLRMLISKYCEEHQIRGFISKLSDICSIFNSRINRSTGFAPVRLHFDRDAIAEHQYDLLNKLERSKNQVKKSNSLQLGNFVRYKLLPKTFAKEVDKRFSRSVHTVVKVKMSAPPVYRIFPTPPDQNRFFYREELLKIDRPVQADTPIEKVVSTKILPNGQTLYECSLLGYEKKEWLTGDSLRRRFLMFPDDSSITLLKDADKRSQGVKTRSSKVDSEKNVIMTRSKTKAVGLNPTS